MTKYLVFHPDQPGIVWAEVSKDGETENVIVQNIIQAMKRGKYTKKGYDIRCVPNTKDRYGSLTAKKKDCVKLGDLFAPKKNRGNSRGLYTIKDKDRFKGRNWERDRPEIERLIDGGFSVSEMAKRLGVTASALSKANRRHNLYAPKQPPCK